MFEGRVGDGGADFARLALFDVAQEVERPVEALRLDPFHVRCDGRELAGGSERAGADVVGNRDGDEGAEFQCREPEAMSKE